MSFREEEPCRSQDQGGQVRVPWIPQEDYKETTGRRLECASFWDPEQMLNPGHPVGNISLIPAQPGSVRLETVEFFFHLFLLVGG